MFTCRWNSWFFGFAFAGMVLVLWPVSARACSSAVDGSAPPACCANSGRSVCHCCESKAARPVATPAGSAIAAASASTTQSRPGIACRSTFSLCGCRSSQPASAPDQRQARQTDETSGNACQEAVATVPSRSLPILSLADSTAFADGERTRSLRTSHLRF